MRKITPRQYAVSLYGALTGVEPDHVAPVIAGFVRLLANRKDISKADKIISAFVQHCNAEDNLVEVSVTSAAPLTNQARETIVNRLKRSLNREVILVERVDPSLMGGVVIRYGDTVVDGSVRDKLEQLKSALHQAA